VVGRRIEMSDPVQDLAHDHADIHRRVLALGQALRALAAGGGDGLALALAAGLGELREQLFLHFAREEEGLFPLVTDAVPELADQVQAMALAHDAICGGLARMVHLASANAELTAITAVFDRFEAAYASHAAAEAALLTALRDRLSPDQRAQLAALVAGL
jgi:iron-sulfur cluster repair protein YtfE (RIC family)